MQSAPVRSRDEIYKRTVTTDFEEATSTNSKFGGYEMKYDLLKTGRRIAEIRKDNALTQEKFADELNVSTYHISKIEQGKGGASIEILVDIACKYGVSLDYLIMGKGNNNTETVKATLKSAIEALTKLENELGN